MNSSLITLALVFAVAALVNGQGVPVCLDNSVASTVVQGMKAVAASNSAAFATTTKAGIQQAFQLLAGALNTYGSPFVSFSGAGFDNKNFYGIQPLVSGYYLWSVRNQAAYGDIKRHFYLSASAPDVTTVAETRTTDFDPTARPWYKAGNGWETYTFAAGFSGEGRNGSTAYASFAGGVALSDRDFLEPCGFAYERSAAVALARTIADTEGSADWKVNIQKLLQFLQSAESKYISGVYVGTASGRFFFVGDCSVDTTSSGCTGGSAYTIQVSADGETTVGNVNVYTLSKTGVIGQIVTTRTYDPRTRPWYTLANGWTTPYKFASSDLVASTYALEIKTGVVGVDRLNNEPTSSCDKCVAPTAAPTPAPAGPCAQSGCGASNVINVNFAGLLNGWIR